MDNDSKDAGPAPAAKSTTVLRAPKHRTSPFMAEAAIEVRGKKRTIGPYGPPDLVTSRVTGEVNGAVEHRVVRIVDDAKFVKVFADGVAGFYQLGKAGGAVFRYLFDTVQKHPGTDRLYLHFMDAAEEPWHVPKSTFFKGLGELIAKGFVARSANPNLFWLNPLMMFNGDRFQFVQEYRRASRAGLVDFGLPKTRQDQVEAAQRQQTLESPQANESTGDSGTS